MFCSKCGSIVSDGTKFCPKCGSQINVSNPGMSPNSLNPGMGQASGISEKLDRGLIKKIIIAVGLILLVCIFLSYASSSKKSSNNSEVPYKNSVFIGSWRTTHEADSGFLGLFGVTFATTVEIEFVENGTVKIYFDDKFHASGTFSTNSKDTEASVEYTYDGESCCMNFVYDDGDIYNTGAKRNMKWTKIYYPSYY